MPDSQNKSLTPQRKEITSKLLQKIKDLIDWVPDISDTVKSTGVGELISNLSTVAEVGGIIVSESLPPVKAFLKVIEKLIEETDPEILGHVACTLAYIASINHACKSHTQTEQTALAKLANKYLQQIKPSEEIDFSTFSLSNVLQHPFITTSDETFLKLAEEVGYLKDERKELLSNIHAIFTTKLRAILSDKETKDKFDPFYRFIQSDAKDRQAYVVLREAAKYQKWLYEQAPVFDREPFALKHIYIDTECGKLTWGSIRTNQKDKKKELVRDDLTKLEDPFSEKSGGRHPLLETVLEYLANKDFKDLIIIQGVAGAGKSSFTIRLSAKLVELGLCPIRIRLKDLRLDRHISETLPLAVNCKDDRYPSFEKILFPRDLFLDGNIFNESFDFEWGSKTAKICRYVLILDGWDEISLSASEGLKTRVNRLLENVRNEFLHNNRSVPVRVILTGRPSETITDPESLVLREHTPILTIKHLRPNQVIQFVSALAEVSHQKPINASQQMDWPSPTVDLFKKVFQKYEKDFSNDLSYSSLAVLGLPLLLYLSVRVLSFKQENLVEVIENPTTLYRLLVDLTCGKAGKSFYDEAVEGAGHILGKDLRPLLQKTAAAMSISGTESISRKELQLRLKLDDEQLNLETSKAEHDNLLTKLMISFYFKTGHSDSGCEFSHKSFREYLFAECIVEVLKDFGKNQKNESKKHEPFWKDFESNTSLLTFSREISQLLSPQWLSIEVAKHIEYLISWEISRSTNQVEEEKIGNASDKLFLEDWCKVRDGLADLWDWWAGRAHLKLKTNETKSRQLEINNPYVIELIDLAAPLDRGIRKIPPFSDTTTMDAHLGDGIFRLCALVHYHIAINTGWNGHISNNSDNNSIDEYQSNIEPNEHNWILFDPARQQISLKSCINRINSAEQRPVSYFPSLVFMQGINLSYANLIYANLRYANLRYANLHSANLHSANLRSADLRSANLTDQQLIMADQQKAKLDENQIKRLSEIKNLH